MKLKFFTVPIHDNQTAEEEVNRFLAGHRVLSVERHLLSENSSPCWALCVTYMEPGARSPAQRSKIDYREVLSPEDFEIYADLRRLRKELAEREGVPLYSLFTNEQLAAMVQKKVRNREQLSELAGVGPSRIEKYAASFLEVLGKKLPRLVRDGAQSGEAERGPAP